MPGQIKTIYSDSNKQNAVLPRTKVEAITDNDGNSLSFLLSGKQDVLVSGTNIKTINDTSLLGSGNITISGDTNVIETVKVNNTALPVSNKAVNIDLSEYATASDLSSKQDTLVSGTNIKTVNNQSLLGSGNIDIQGGDNYIAGNGINIIDGVISSNLFSGMDTTNKLLEWNTNNFRSYTATEDCWFCKMHDYDSGGAGEEWKIDNEQIIQGKTPFITPLKQGQTITLTGGSAVMWLNVYGVKQ